LNLPLIWLPKQWPEWNAREQFSGGASENLEAAHRQAESVDPLAQLAENW
jgi:hypothetical protein